MGPEPPRKRHFGRVESGGEVAASWPRWASWRELDEESIGTLEGRVKRWIRRRGALKVSTWIKMVVGVLLVLGIVLVVGWGGLRLSKEGSVELRRRLLLKRWWSAQRQWEEMKVVVVVNRRENEPVEATLKGLTQAKVRGRVDLEIWLFRNASWRSMEICGNFRWKFGKYSVKVVPGLVSPFDMWVSLGDTAPDHLARKDGPVPTLYVEDGTVLSKDFQRYLMEARALYGARMDVAGFTLDPVKVRRRTSNGRWEPLTVSPRESPAFLYRLTDRIHTFMPNWNPDSNVWGTFREYLMIRKAEWHKFPDLKDRHSPIAPTNEASNFTMAHWTAWFTKFQAEYRLFTLYPNLSGNEAMMVNHFVPLANEPKQVHSEFSVLYDGGPRIPNSASPFTFPKYRDLKRFETDGQLIVNRPSKHVIEIEKYALSSSHSPRPISFTMVNRAFLDTTRSWLCNVDIPGIRPPNVVWATTDQDTNRILSDIEETHALYLGPDRSSKNGSGLDFGNPGYWKLMLDRTKLISEILDRGIALLNFETDAIWLGNALDHVKTLVAKGADIVGTINTRGEVSGNFFYLKPTLATRHLWHEIAVAFQAAYEKQKFERKAPDSWTYIENDQSILTELVLRNQTWSRSYPLVFLTLDTQKFADGRWYDPEKGWYKENRDRVIMIQNNFVIGVAKKTERAKKWKHWFWKEDVQQCDTEAVLAVMQGKKRNQMLRSVT